VTTIFNAILLRKALDQGAKPDAPQPAQGLSLKEVVLRPPLPLSADQACFLEQAEVFRKRLTRQYSSVPCRQPNVQFEQGLPVSLGEFIDKMATSGIGQGFED
jgi:hypothetical protein